MSSIDTQSVSSSIVAERNAVPYARFNAFDHLLFSFFHPYKLHARQISDSVIIGISILLAFQYIFIPLRRTDVPLLYFTAVYRKIGLYFDPSFYSPTFLSFVIFFVLMGATLILTIALGVIVCLLAKREGGAPAALHSISDMLGILIVVPFLVPFCIIFSKPWACLIQETVSPISENNNFTYCNPTARIPLLVFSAIFLVALFVFSGLYRCLIFDANLRTANLNSTRWGATTCFAQSLGYLSSFLVTILIEFYPTATAIIHSVVFAILMCFEIITLPQTTPYSNSLYSTIYGAAFGSGIASLLMPVWNSLAARSVASGNQTLASLSVVFFYASWVLICAVFGVCAGLFAYTRHKGLALIKPIYSLSEHVSPSLPSPQASSPQNTSLQPHPPTLLQHAQEIEKSKKNKNRKKAGSGGRKPIGLRIEVDGAVVTHLFSTDEKMQSQSHFAPSRAAPSTASLPQASPSPPPGLLFASPSSPFISQQSPSVLSSYMSSSSTSSSASSSSSSSPPSIAPSMSSSPFTSPFPFSSSSSSSFGIIPSQSSPTFDSVSPFITNQPSIIKAILRTISSPSAIWTKISFLSDPTFRQQQEVVCFVDNLFVAALKKEKFSTSSDLMVSYSLFLSSFMSMIHRPNALATQLQRACDQFPSWIDRWLIYVKSKEMEAFIRRRETFSSTDSAIGKGKSVSEFGGTASMSNTYNTRLQLQQAAKNDEISKAHMFRVWSLLSRRSIDVPKVMHHIVEALKYAHESEDTYTKMLLQSPDNPSVMRRLALVLRDVYSDDETANKLLHEADELEEPSEMDELLSMGSNEDDVQSTLEGDGWGDSAWGSGGGGGGGNVNGNGGAAGGGGAASGMEIGRALSRVTSRSNGISLNISDGPLMNKSPSSFYGRGMNVQSQADFNAEGMLQYTRERNMRKAKKAAQKRKERGNTRRSKKNKLDSLTKDEKEKSKTMLNALLPIVLSGVGLVAATIMVTYILINSRFNESTTYMDTSRKCIQLSIYQNHVLYLMVQSLASFSNPMPPPTPTPLTPSSENGDADRERESDDNDNCAIDMAYQANQRNQMSQMNQMNKANQASSRDDFDKQRKEAKETIISQSQLLPELFTKTAESSAWKSDLASFVVCYMDSAQVNLVKEFVTENLNLITLINWSQDIALDLVDNSAKFPDYLSLLSFFQKGAASFVLNAPLSISSELEVIVTEGYDRVMKISNDNLILLIVLLVFCIAVLLCATIIPVMIFIRIVIRERKKAMRLLCTISAEYAAKMVERLEGSSKGASQSHHDTMSSAVTETSQTDRAADDAAAAKNTATPLPEASTIDENDNDNDNIITPLSAKPTPAISATPSRAGTGTPSNFAAAYQLASLSSQHSFSGQTPQMQQSSLMSFSRQPSFYSPSPGPQQMQILSRCQSQSQSQPQYQSQSRSQTTDQPKKRKKVKQLTPKQFKYDLGVLDKGRMEEDNELLEEEKEEKERIAQQRIDDMDEKLRVLGGVVPPSVKWQLAVGSLLLICLACSFYAVSIVAITGIVDHSGKIIMSGYRRIALKQLSALATMVAGKITFPVADESVFFKDPISSSPVFRNSSFLTSVEHVKSTLSAQMQFIQSLSKRFLLGPSPETMTADDRLDSIALSRTQGENTLIDEMMTAPTSCLLINRSLCDIISSNERMPGVSTEFNGLSELVVRAVTAVSDLVKTPEDALDLNNINYLFIKGVSLYDAEDALILIGDELQKKASEFTSRYSTVLLVVFISVAVLASAVVGVFILPIPVYIQAIMRRTEAIVDVAGKREIGSVKWSEDLVTSVARIDDAHYVLVDGLSQLVVLVNNNEPQEKIRTLLDQLLIATFIHFSDEEKMMQSYKYPTKLRNEHLLAHIHLLRKLVNFLDRMSTQRLPLTDVILFSSTWIINHIQSLDVELSLFLQQKGDQSYLNGAIDLSHFEMPGSIEAWLESDQAPMKERLLFETSLENAKKRCKFLIQTTR